MAFAERFFPGSGVAGKTGQGRRGVLQYRPDEVREEARDRAGVDRADGGRCQSLLELWIPAQRCRQFNEALLLDNAAVQPDGRNCHSSEQYGQHGGSSGNKSAHSRSFRSMAVNLS